MTTNPVPRTDQKLMKKMRKVRRKEKKRKTMSRNV